jgi:ABC-2 type transport system permease protein
MTTKIGNDVTDGSIAMSLIKPISYKRKLLSESIGEMIYKFFIPSIFVWIGVEVYKIFNLGNYSFSIKNTIFFCISSILGFLIYFLFEFCFGMLAFYSTYVWGMEIIKNGVLIFLTGQLIPLTFFPVIIQKIFDFLPFSSMNYIPVMIYLGKIDNLELVYTLIRQLIWIIILEIFSSWLWKKAIKRISILGG